MANSFLFEQLPIDVTGNVGSQISLSTILTDAFGSNWSGYSEFWLAYYGAAALQTWDFNYWDPNDVAPFSYPIGIGVWRVAMPCWAVRSAVRCAEPSVEHSAADRRAAA